MISGDFSVWRRRNPIHSQVLQKNNGREVKKIILHLATFGAFEILGMTRRVSHSKELASHTAELCLNQLVTAGTTASSPGRRFE
jgi:hypothetical protein